MTRRFVARVTYAEEDPDGYFLQAGLAETEDDSGFSMVFMCDAREPDAQEVALGLDTHCLVTPGQGTAYGCVRAVALDGRVLSVSLDPSALGDLDLDHPEIVAVLDVPPEDVAEFRAFLRRIMTYGREGARPRLLGV